MTLEPAADSAACDDWSMIDERAGDGDAATIRTLGVAESGWDL
jgi:hypothetical protein